MVRHSYRATQAIIPLHEQPRFERAIFSPPEWALADETTWLNYDIFGPRDLALPTRKEISINGYATRALNTFLALQKDREAWVEPSEIYQTYFHPSETGLSLSSVTTLYKRGLDGLRKARQLSDGRLDFIEQTGHGSGSKPQYRLHPEIGFTDLRHPAYRPEIEYPPDHEGRASA